MAWKAKSPLKIEEVEVLPPGKGEVRIKVGMHDLILSAAMFGNLRTYLRLYAIQMRIHLMVLIPKVFSRSFLYVFRREMISFNHLKFAFKGHEASGIVESIGEGVTSLKPGNVCAGFFLIDHSRFSR